MDYGTIYTAPHVTFVVENEIPLPVFNFSVSTGGSIFNLKDLNYYQIKSNIIGHKHPYTVQHAVKWLLQLPSDIKQELHKNRIYFQGNRKK